MTGAVVKGLLLLLCGAAGCADGRDSGASVQGIVSCLDATVLPMALRFPAEWFVQSTRYCQPYPGLV